MKERHILILSTCTEDWGGSEELWARSVPFLMASGNQVTVCKRTINTEHPEFRKLAAAGVKLHALTRPGELPDDKQAELSWREFIKEGAVSLAVISQGMNFDGLGFGYICLTENIPYAMISQKAVETFWPDYKDRVAMRNVYLNAEKAYFVSRHNLKLTEEQFGIRFQHAEIVSNPVRFERFPRPYPDAGKGYRLACIGRFFIIDKGQDILIRILARDKWRSRPLSVSFIGSGIDRNGLVELARLLKVDRVEFIEQNNDLETLWENYHGLILPSRFEGTPLVLLEAMALGRMSIVSTAGGNPELITEGESGFLGHPDEEGMDEAMERAWAVRDTWQQMGIAACEAVKRLVPALPEHDLAKSIMQLTDRNRKLVSVIVPTYNRAGIVEAAILSVLDQTYPHIQLIVADDGSEDATDELMSKYPQVTYLKLPHGGQAHARNEGLRHARGEFIATLDSDDIWEPHFIERSLDILEQHKLDFVFSNWMQDMGEDQFVDRFSICKVLEDTLAARHENTIILDNTDLRNLYLTGCPSPSSSLLIRRSSLSSNWTSGLRIADDWCLLMDIIYRKPSKAGFTRDVLWHKKIDGKNIYDGRNMYDLIGDLWTHDLEFLYDRIKALLARDEKKRMRVALSENYLQYSYYQFRHNKNYLEGTRYSFMAVLANNRIILQVILGFKMKIRKALKRLGFLRS